MNSPACGVSTHGPAIGAKQLLRRLGERGQCVGVKHRRPPGRERGENVLTRRRADACAGTDGDDVARASASRCSNAASPSKRRTITFVSARRRWAIRSPAQRGSPCPRRRGTRRRGHSAGAGHLFAAEDQHFAPLVLVAFGLWPRIAVEPQAGTVLPGVRADGAQARTPACRCRPPRPRRRAHVLDRAGARASCGKRSPSGRPALRRRAPSRRRRRGRSGHPRRRSGLGAISWPRRGPPPGRPKGAKPAPKIASTITPASSRLLGMNGARSSFQDRRPRRRLRELIARAKQSNFHRPSRRGEVTGDDKAIAAIVTWPAQDRDGPHRPALPDRDRDGAASGLHHSRAADAGRLSCAVGVTHLGGRQQREAAVFEPNLGDHVHPPTSAMLVAIVPCRKGSELTQRKASPYAPALRATLQINVCRQCPRQGVRRFHRRRWPRRSDRPSRSIAAHRSRARGRRS